MKVGSKHCCPSEFLRRIVGFLRRISKPKPITNGGPPLTTPAAFSSLCPIFMAAGFKEAADLTSAMDGEEDAVAVQCCVSKPTVAVQCCVSKPTVAAMKRDRRCPWILMGWLLDLMGVAIDVEKGLPLSVLRKDEDGKEEIQSRRKRSLESEYYGDIEIEKSSSEVLCPPSFISFLLRRFSTKLALINMPHNDTSRSSIRQVGQPRMLSHRTLLKKDLA
ncbi:hypothetical protein ACLOJK_011888 [Asimina triloba]